MSLLQNKRKRDVFSPITSKCFQDLNTKYIELNQTINKKSENLKLMTTEIEKLKAELSKSTSQRKRKKQAFSN